MILYHCTRSTNKAAILRQGLKPGLVRHVEGIKNPPSEAVFLAESVNNALALAPLLQGFFAVRRAMRQARKIETLTEFYKWVNVSFDATVFRVNLDDPAMARKVIKGRYFQDLSTGMIIYEYLYPDAIPASRISIEGETTFEEKVLYGIKDEFRQGLL